MYSYRSCILKFRCSNRFQAFTYVVNQSFTKDKMQRGLQYCLCMTAQGPLHGKLLKIERSSSKMALTAHAQLLYHFGCLSELHWLGGQQSTELI